MLLRGQNLLGYAPYPDDVVDHFVAAAARDGIDIFLIFDGLNDVRNVRRAAEAALSREEGGSQSSVYVKSCPHGGIFHKDGAGLS